MKKVLVVATSHLTRGGVTSVVRAHERGRQWHDYGCEWIETHRDGNIIVKLWWLLKGICRYIVKLPSCDLVHIHASEPASALRKRLFFMPLAKSFGKKVIVHFHAFSPETTTRGRYSNLYRYLFERADRVVVLSEYWRREVNRFSLEANVVVIYNPCVEDVPAGTSENVEERRDDSGKFQILFAGTINQRKGYADLVTAFANVVKDDDTGLYNDWQLAFAGNGEIDRGRHLAEMSGVGERVKWLGWVRGEEKAKVFRQSSIFCLPSYAEGFPMAVLDAWAYGIPVITTPVGGIPDVAVDGENMLLFNPGDVDALSDCLKRLMGDANLRNTISKASSALAQNTFNIDVVNDKIGELYRTLLDN